MIIFPRIVVILVWINVCLSAGHPRHIRREEASITTGNADPPKPTMCGDLINNVNEGYNLFYASDVFECLVSVPFIQAVALKFIDYYNTTMQFQSTLAYLRNPPPTYQQPTVDFAQQLEEIKVNVTSGVYGNQYAFEADIQHLVQSVHDAHVYLVGGALSAFVFGSNRPLMTLSVDGVKTPQVYFQSDVRNRLNYVISPIIYINGEDAVGFLSRFAALNAHGSLEPHGDWNKIMYSPVQEVLNIYDTFSMNAPFYWGDFLSFTMENGTVINTPWTALYTNSDFTGPLTTGGDYYNYFVLGLLPASYYEVPLPCVWDPNATQACEGWVTGDSTPEVITSWFNKTNGAFPLNPDVTQPELMYGLGGGTVTGYILDEISVGVLSIPSFVAYGWDISNFSDTVGEFIRRAQETDAKRIIIDLQGNSGGLTELAFVTFNQFFPQHYPIAGSRRRNHKLADILGTSLSNYWTGLPTNSDEKFEYEANEWVITDRLNAQTGKNFSSWAEYFESPVVENGDKFSLVEQYDLANQVFNWAAFQNWSPINYAESDLDTQTLPPWNPQDVVMLTDGACSSACTLFTEMMTRQAGVRVVVVGGRPEPGPMQATSGSRGASVYSAQSLDKDIAEAFSNRSDEYLQLIDPATKERDSGMFLLAADLNLRDQVRNPRGPPLQFTYEAADCRLYWTLQNALNMTQLWYDTAGAIWELGLNTSCVRGSTGYATRGVNSSATSTAPQNTATLVPSLPVLKWNDNVPPGEFEDVGLTDRPSYYPTPNEVRGKDPVLCSTDTAVRVPNMRCIKLRRYFCDEGQNYYAEPYTGEYLLQCNGNRDKVCGDYHNCSITHDPYFESSVASQLTADIRREKISSPRGTCWPLTLTDATCI